MAREETNTSTAMSLALLTALALVAFAGNSILCRVALRGELIDARLFTTLRVASGALALVVWMLIQKKGGSLRGSGSWRGAGFLLVYMVAFSWAYLNLQTGVGALILFGAVQITMVGWAALKGEIPNLVQGVGLAVALGGLTWLLLAPGSEAPSLTAGALMALGGVSWGGYTLCGKGSTDPLRETAGNFLRATPVAVLIAVISAASLVWTSQGIILAVVSGVVTSAIGYAIWYQCLRSLTATRAAVLQLLVPVLASVGGWVFGAEALTTRLVLASILVLGGVGLVLKGKR